MATYILVHGGGHSCGGTVITGVADRAGARIATLVYLDADHEIDTGHDLMLTEPDAVADLLLGVADEVERAGAGT